MSEEIKAETKPEAEAKPEDSGPKVYAIGGFDGSAHSWASPASAASAGSTGPKSYSLFPEGARRRSSGPVFNLKTSTSHKVRTFGNQKYWAHGGRIQIVDDTNGEYVSCSIEAFGARAMILARSAMKALDPQEQRRLVKVVADMRDTIYEAKAQGDPHDPKVLEYKMRQRGRKAKLGYGSSDYFAKTGPLAGDDYFPTSIVGKQQKLHEA